MDPLIPLVIDVRIIYKASRLPITHFSHFDLSAAAVSSEGVGGLGSSKTISKSYHVIVSIITSNHSRKLDPSNVGMVPSVESDAKDFASEKNKINDYMSNFHFKS